MSGPACKADGEEQALAAVLKLIDEALTQAAPEWLPYPDIHVAVSPEAVDEVLAGGLPEEAEVDGNTVTLRGHRMVSLRGGVFYAEGGGDANTAVDEDELSAMVWLRARAQGKGA